MNSFRLFRLLVGLAATLMLVGSAQAQTASVTSTTTTYSAAGGSVTFDVSIQYPGVSLAYLALNIELPTGWSYASRAGTNRPDFAPAVGTTEAAEMFFTEVPANSAVFSVTLNYVSNLTGDQTFPSELLYKVEGAPSSVTLSLPTVTLAPVLSAVQAHASVTLSADWPYEGFTPVIGANGAPPYTFAISPALPTGLSLDTTTGAIAGRPATASAARVHTITITDSTNATASTTFSLTVNPKLTSTLVAPNTSLTVNTAAAFTPMTIAGGTSAFSFFIDYEIDPPLPAGLTLNAVTGAISGTPTVTASETARTIAAIDATGAMTKTVFRLTVNPAPVATQAIASRTLTVGTAAVPFTPVTVSSGTAPYSYVVSPALPANLVLNPATGQITGTPASASAATTYTVTATDSAGATASQTFTLSVNGPVAAVQAIASRATTVSVPVLFTPVTASGGTAPYTFAVSPALLASLTMNPSTGAISGAPNSAAAATAYTVTVTDGVGAVASQTFSLTVNGPVNATQAVATKALTVNTPAAPFTPVTRVSGGTAPFSYAVSPSLPAGLSFSTATGEITGTPTAISATTTYWVNVNDSAGAVDSESFTLTVNPAVVATQAVASKVFTAGTAVTTFTPVTASGGTTPYTFAVYPALPGGLTLNSATGAVTGTPAAASALTTYTISITDAATATASQTFTIDVNGPVTATQVVASKSLTATTAAVAFAPVTGAGGTAPYSYAIAPALPSGLAFNTATGSITGTPGAAMAATTFTVTVTDSATATAANTFSLNVNPALATTQAIPNKFLTAGTAAVAFVPVTATGGTQPYTFTVAPALPGTLALNTTTGAISGMANVAMSATTFTVTVTDNVGAVSNKTFSLTVSSSPTPTTGQTVTNKILTAGAPAVPFTPLPVTGGTPPFTYSVSPALPDGLSLDTNTGAIAGTAAAPAASAVYTLTATDSVGAVVSLELTLLVNPAPVATQAVPSKTLLVNVAAVPFTPVTFTGGTPPLAYTINPSLPTGLAISASTGAISGTPSVVSGAVTHTVTATDAVGAFASATFALKINRAPVITVQPTTAPFHLVNGVLELSVVATGSPAPTYQWRKDEEPITDNETATAATLTIPVLQLTDEGVYDVIVTNESGELTSDPANVVVYLPPAFTTPPVNQTITAGGSATFSVVATGSPELTYQWHRNGVALPGATAATLTLNNVPLNGGGAITVVVTNPGGSRTSDAATLTVNPIAPDFAAGLATTATAIKDRPFFFPVAINRTIAAFTATGLGGPGGTLAVNPNNGSLSGTPANLGTFSIVITAANSAGSATHTLSLTVQPPPPVITSDASKNGRVGDATFSFQVVGTNSPTHYAATNLPPGLTIDAITGLITGTPTTAGTFTVGLTVTNASGSISQPLVITIDRPLNAPVYAGTLTPSGTQGVVFSFTPAFGSVTAPYGLTGTLPAGLTFTEATGIISGTPTETGSFPVTLSATNAGGSTAVELTIVINPAAAAPVITSASAAPAARVGTAFSFTLTSVGTPTATSYTAVGLPGGLALNGATGAITGTPTVYGDFEVSVAATNTVGTGPNSILAISIAPSATAPVITSAPVARGRVGQAFSYTLAASNSPTAFAITSGILPDGLALNGSTGAITGTPSTAALGETRVWFNGSNVSGSGLSLEVLFVIAPALSTPVVNSNGTATAQVGQPFQYRIAASSATEIASYAATGRPAWLALDAVTGVLSGVPTEATATPLAIGMTATNADGTGSSKTLLLTVAPAPATPIITSALSAAGRVGSSFTYQVSASESPTSYVATGLPPGLSLDSTTGAITGVPTGSKAYEVVLRAANGSGLGAPSTLVIRIAPALAAPAITSSATASGRIGTAFSYQVTASNGPILSYEVSGTLPLGLRLNTATGVITGTPAAGARAYLVELTATNAAGTSLPQPLSIDLAPALGVPVVTTPLFVSGQIGVDFSFTITATNLTGSAPYAPPILLDAVNLPPGLAVNPATGEIQGTPTAVGTTVASLTATNAAGTGLARDLSITIRPAPSAPVIDHPGSAVGQVNQPFSYQIVASNSPTSYEVLGAPAWMTLNGATGAVGGSPTAPGVFTVQLVASNGDGSSDTVPLEVIIFPAANTPVVISSRTQSGTVGTALSFMIDVAPSGLNLGFVATGLPSGLYLDPTTGVVSGTPNESGTFNVMVSPFNDNGAGAPVMIVIKIQPNVQFGG